MAVDHKVDHIRPHDTEVGLRGHGIGGSKQDVLKIGGQHGTAPAISDGGAGALLHQVFIILVHPNVGSVHNFNNFPVDIAARNFIRMIAGAAPPLVFSKCHSGVEALVWQKGVRRRPCPTH